MVSAKVEKDLTVKDAAALAAIGRDPRATSPSSPNKNATIGKLKGSRLNPAEHATWRQAIIKDYKKLAGAPAAMRSDRPQVLAAMRNGSWKALQYASEELRGDVSFVREAVTIGGMCLQYGSEVVRKDREVVLAACKKDGMALQYAYFAAHKDDFEIVQEAVQQDWRSYQFASVRLRSMREMAMEAVKQNWNCLQYVSDECQGDREIIREALKQNGEALRYASETLRPDRSLASQASDMGVSIVAFGDEISYPHPDAWGREAAQVNSRRPEEEDGRGGSLGEANDKVEEPPPPEAGTEAATAAAP
jgi:hypothetical protein